MLRVLQSIYTWVQGILVDAVIFVYGSIFSFVNDKVANVAGQLSTSPADFSPGIFSMIRTLSENVIMPIAGIILTFVACIELIQMVIDHNNLANFETWFIWRWIIKTFIAVELVTHVFDITMAVFDVADWVVAQSGSLIGGGTAINADLATQFRSSLEAMNVGELLVVLMMSLAVWIGIYIISLIIWVTVYARMIEIYLTISLAPIPFSTMGNKEHSQIGWNYFRSLAALGFQGFLMMVCIGIYAVLIQTITISSDIISTIWGIMGYTVLLCFTLIKTYEVSKSVFNAR